MIRTDNTRLLFTNFLDEIYSFTISSNGIIATSNSPITVTNIGIEDNTFKELEVVSIGSNYRIATSNGSTLAVGNFSSSGSLTGSFNLYTFPLQRWIHGLEFSPNGTYLYISHELTPYLEKVDASVYPLAPVSIGLAGDLSPYAMGQIELAPYSTGATTNSLYFACSGGMSDLKINSAGAPITPLSSNWNIVPISTPLVALYLNDQIDGEIYFPATPTITGSNYACNTTETYILGGSYSSSVVYNWTVTGGTPTSFTTLGTTLSEAITWTATNGQANGGTITVSAQGAGGCSTPATFTVNPCCRHTETGKTTVYLNDKTENTSGIYTPTSYPGGVSGNYIYVINGTYTINGNPVTFSGCQTFLGKNAIVKVNPGAYLNLNGGTIWQAGCNDMWTGITLVQGSPVSGKLLVDNSTIQDAQLAIDSKGGAQFTVTNSTLNKNYRGIYLEAYAGTHPGVIKNSSISCVDYLGNAITLPLNPRIGQRAYSGIEVSNVGSATIGAAQLFQTNVFDNLEMGIINFASNLNVYNNDFTRISYTSNYQRGRCISSTNSLPPALEKTLIVGGAGAYQSNTFTDSYLGVYAATNQDVNIVTNYFNNLAHTAAYLYNCKTAGNVIAVNYNTIDDCATGIYGYDNNGCTTFDVKSNKINLATAGANSKYNSKAISILNPTQSLLALPQLTILSNYIKRVGVGVEATYFTAPDIEHNVISNINDVGYNTMVEAMRITHCPTAQVRENRVTGGPSFTNFSWTAGIRIEYCSNSLVTRDTVENIGRGLFFGGDCNSSELAKNLMKDNYDGLLLNVAEIGYQNGSSSSCIAPGNLWQGTFNNSHIYSNSSYGALSPMNLYGSTCSTSSGPCMNPSPFLSLVSGFPYTVVPTSVCTTLSTRSMSTDDDLDYMLQVVHDEITYPLFDTSGKWMAKYELYGKLATNPDLQADVPELTAFVDSVAATTMGALSNVSEMLATTDTATAETTANVIASNIVEKNLNDALAITVAYRQSDVLSPSEIQTLQSIAVQCPYEGGPGVYTARVLLSTVDSTQYINSCEIVPTEAGRSMMENTGTIGSAIKVFPNPANDKLNIAIQLEANQTGTLTVYDLTGKSVLSYALAADTDVKEISTGALSPGLYIYKIIINNTQVNSGKLSIIH